MAGNDYYTVLLPHFNSNYTDYSINHSVTHTPTAGAGVSIDTTNKKFGAGSAAFDGVSTNHGLVYGEMQADMGFAAGDFTIDCWVRFDAVNVNQAILGCNNTLLNLLLMAFRFNVTKLQFYTDYFHDGVHDIIDVQCDWSPSISTWYHVAVVRDGTAFYLFVGGVKQTCTGDTSSYETPNTVGTEQNPVWLGDQNKSADHRHLNGNIDELRISKGIARWTDDFVVMTAQYEPPFPKVNIGDVWHPAYYKVNIGDSWKLVRTMKVAIGRDNTFGDLDGVSFDDLDGVSFAELGNRVWKEITI